MPTSRYGRDFASSPNPSRRKSGNNPQDQPAKSTSSRRSERRNYPSSLLSSECPPHLTQPPAQSIQTWRSSHHALPVPDTSASAPHLPTSALVRRRARY